MTTSLLKQPLAYMTTDGPGVMSNYMGFSASAPLLGHPPYRGRHGEPMSPFFVPASSTYTIPEFYHPAHYGNIPFSDSKPVVPEQQEIAVNALLALNPKSSISGNASPPQSASGACTPTTMAATAFRDESPPDLISALRISSSPYTPGPGEPMTGFDRSCLHENPYHGDVKPIIQNYCHSGSSPVGTPITSPVSAPCDRSPNVLKSRPKTMHKTGNNICQICGKSYARPSTLKTHMRTHSGEKPYKCEVCSKAFTQAANLTAHLRTHSGEKPFSCPICHKRFSQSSSVTTHLRTHSGERPYRCDYCGKAFADTSTLTKHKRIHSGEKPYRCKICNLGFSQSGNLHRHMKTHNN